jgi:hypothetical protein
MPQQRTEPVRAACPATSAVVPVVVAASRNVPVYLTGALGQHNMCRARESFPSSIISLSGKRDPAAQTVLASEDEKRWPGVFANAALRGPAAREGRRRHLRQPARRAVTTARFAG